MGAQVKEKGGLCVRSDVVQLREFYASPLGLATRRTLSDVIGERWPSLGGDLLVGIGYANPLLRSFLRREKQSKKDGAMVLPLMPAGQGAIVWPDYGANRSILCDEHRLPLRDGQANRLLLLHAFEHSADPAKLLAECWRVLTPGGRMMVIVPRRRGLWTRAQRAPFAGGQCFTPAQLREQICEQFTHLHTGGVLHFPPLQARWLLKFSGVLGRLMPWVAPMFGGALLMEVEKQLYAGIKERASPRSLRDYVPAAVKPALSRHRRDAPHT